ncbi:transcriptional regulator, HxlR family [Parasphingorhabdus marina DSM 22363]|uniref:Transcriptional regulator, HxlR family n=1 Tax=Parasphingorhabdus marina DSM 22363 TaxID=1123272 RepID=A0A1N6GQU2_9SPHN|nr:winged helix-turn-helix transcriptional regulator [Parasphingorhabdus marina]SIO09904.1 transcriptional regulator, HxlR family [Parasphingorhabdus marina DSM 22363]
MSNDDLATTVALARYRWIVPLLAILADRNGARFAEMARGLAISADSLSSSLQYVMAMGWVRKNPGHGHPLRPEYLLTDEGRAVAMRALAVHQVQERLDCDSRALKRWSLPIVHVLGSGVHRFNAINRTLDAATPRAISLSMKAAQEQDLVKRSLLDGFPPVTDYSLSRRGEELASALVR